MKSHTALLRQPSFISNLLKSGQDELSSYRETKEGSIEDWTEYFKDRNLVLKTQYESVNQNSHTRCRDVVFGHSPEEYHAHQKMAK